MMTGKQLSLRLSVIVGLMLASLIFAVVVSAQASNQVVINFLEAAEALDQKSLILRVYFTVTNDLKKPLTDASIKSATIALDAEDGGNYPAKVSQATGPISLVIVLDTSGSMVNTITKMKAAASDMVKNAPKDSRFAIIRFSDKVQLLQDFTDDRDKVTAAIGTIKAFGPTCLFDATYQGVQLLASGIQGRRAVVVFTDGKDDNGAGKVCSTKTTTDITQLAGKRTLRIPIYSIGLQGGEPIAEADLQNMSDATGGTVAIGSDVTALFKQIVDAINAQYVAEANVSPKQGDLQMSLRVILNDGSVPNADNAVFTSPKDYSIKPTPTPTITPTVLPVSATITTVSEDFVKQELILSVQTQTDTLIKKYHIEIIDDNTNLLSKELVLNTPPFDGIHVPVSDLPVGKYDIKLTALGDSDAVLGTSTIKFQYLLSTPTPGPAPTDTPTPEPGDLGYKLGKAIGDPSKGPVVVGLLFAVVIGLILLIVFLFVRKPKKTQTGTSFLREMTGAVNVSELAGYTPSWSKGNTPDTPKSEDRQQRPPANVPTMGLTADDIPVASGQPSFDKTNVYVEMPSATLTVENSSDSASIGRVVSIGKVPFTLGRAERDLNLPSDVGVSREHAQITYNDFGGFFITDNGSTNHTFINDVEIPANTPQEIKNGDVIRLGAVTQLKFATSTVASGDPDRTRTG